MTTLLTFERVLKRAVESDDGCWLYAGPDNGRGYKKVGHHYAHRYVYELLVGPIPAGHHIDHLCRVRACVNPAHLEPVTPGENVRRSIPFRSVVAGPTKHGTVAGYQDRGCRCDACRIANTDYMRAWRARRRLLTDTA